MLWCCLKLQLNNNNIQCPAMKIFPNFWAVHVEMTMHSIRQSVECMLSCAAGHPVLARICRPLLHFWPQLLISFLAAGKQEHTRQPRNIQWLADIAQIHTLEINVSSETRSLVFSGDSRSPLKNLMKALNPLSQGGKKKAQIHNTFPQVQGFYSSPKSHRWPRPCQGPELRALLQRSSPACDASSMITQQL